MKPVKASGWFNSNLTEEDQQLLRQTGITPVNDIFYDLWGNNNPINLIYGGYGSGKSNFIGTDLLQKCLGDEYFKCYYGRKVLEDVRGSVHSKFISLIKDNHLESYFKFSSEPNGSMIIRAHNGNMFIPFGASTQDGLKSIDDPTHFFMEEMDQFTAADFSLILSRLRTKRGTLQLYGAFNTEKVFPGHWLLSHFFPEFGFDEEQKKEITEIIDAVGVHKLFCNYTDNYFIDQVDYYNKLKLAAAGDTSLLLSMATGAWGSYKSVNPFITQFDQARHVSSGAFHRPNTPIHISVDFNLNPFCLNFFHLWRDEKGEHLHFFDEMAMPAGSIPKIAEQVKLKYGKYLSNCFVTGDAMGSRRDISQRDNATYYIQLMRGLGLSTTQMKLPANPTHENSRADCNYIFCHFPDLKFHPKFCMRTINDIKTVECDNFNQIIKKNRTKENQQADHLDCFVAETLVSTIGGQKRIDEINIDELVLTPNGYKKIIDKWDSVADVWEFTLSDGAKIQCTKEHKFYVHGIGWYKIFNIFEEKLNIWKTKSSTTESGIQNTPNKNIITALKALVKGSIQDACTDRCGLMLTGKYQTAMRFITKTAMLLTIRLKTLKSYLNQNIKAFISLSELKTIRSIFNSLPKQGGNLLKRGTAVKKALNGTVNRPLKQVWEHGITAIVNAISVELNLKREISIHGFAPTIVNHNGEEKTNQILFCETVKNAGVNSKQPNIHHEDFAHYNASLHQTLTVVKAEKVGLKRVYDITVEDENCFYANNVLVHNCVRYSVNTFLRPWINTHQRMVKK